MKTLFLVFVSYLVLGGALAGLLPPDVKFINSGAISMTNGFGPPTPVTNGSWMFVSAADPRKPAELRVSVPPITSWTFIKEDSEGHIAIRGTMLVPGGTCMPQPGDGPGSYQVCDNWIQQAGPESKTTWNTTCVIVKRQGKESYSLMAVTENGQLLSLITSYVRNGRPGSDTVVIDKQFNYPPSISAMLPCIPNADAHTGAVDDADDGDDAATMIGVHPLGGIFGGIKCGACKLGIGAILGRLCGGGGAAVCSAFPPAVPFCAILAQAACKGGASLGKDQACKIIKMC